MRGWIAAVVAGCVVGGLGAVPAEAAEPVSYELGDAQTDELTAEVAAAPQTLAGVSFDPAGRRATVRYAAAATTGRRHAHETVGRLAGRPGSGRSWRVVLEPVRYSRADLDTAQEQVGTDRSWLPAGTPAPIEWYVDVAANAVEVGFAALTPQLRAAAQRRFGDRVRLHVATPMVRTSSRTDDFDPWASGIKLLINDHFCTGGIVLKDRSAPSSKPVKRLLTAGHCGNVGDEVRQADGEFVGTIVERRFSDRGYDVAYIAGAGGYVPWSYTGPADSTLGKPVAGGRLPAAGLLLCTEGAESGERCGGRVRADKGCVTFLDGITTCHLVFMDPTQGSLSRRGDSGGPVVEFVSNGIRMAGTIVGSGPAGVTVYHSFEDVTLIGYALDFDFATL